MYSMVSFFLFSENLYFLKGGQFWEFYDNKMRIRKSKGTDIGKLLNCRNGKFKSDLKIEAMSNPLEKVDMDSASNILSACRCLTTLVLVSAIAVLLH